jgi:hypothetical protein
MSKKSALKEATEETESGGILKRTGSKLKDIATMPVTVAGKVITSKPVKVAAVGTGLGIMYHANKKGERLENEVQAAKEQVENYSKGSNPNAISLDFDKKLAEETLKEAEAKVSKYKKRQEFNRNIGRMASGFARSMQRVSSTQAQTEAVIDDSTGISTSGKITDDVVRSSDFTDRGSTVDDDLGISNDTTDNEQELGD